MTIKRVNFTGRRRVPRNRVQISVYDGEPRTFDASIDLGDLLFLPHAAVFLEATCAGSAVIERFSFGEVGDVRPPSSRRLARLEGENVFFTLKIVDCTERFGRILGIAEHIRPLKAGKQTVTGRRGILPIEPADLGQELWQLDLSGDHDAVLLVNKDARGLLERVRSDPFVYGIIFPEILRRVLVAAVARNVDLDDDDERWPVLWLRFGKDLHPRKETPPKSDDPEGDRDEWIEEVVESFCEKHALKDRFLAAGGANGGDS